MTEPQRAFDRLAAGYLGDPDVSPGRIFHSEGLTVQGKIFALLVRDDLVVKVPAAQAAALVADGSAVPFEPRPGRAMREWIRVGLAAGKDRWEALVADAYAYVRGGLAR